MYGTQLRLNSVSQVTATLGANDPQVGDLCLEGDEKYVFVYNAGNTQISTGRAATVSAVTGYSVTVSSVSGDVCVGFVKHATLTTGTYGWLVCRGFVDSVTNAMASTALAAGDVIQLGVDGGVAKGVTGPTVGKMMTATGSAGVAHAFISVF